LKKKEPSDRTSKFIYNAFFAASYQIVVLAAGFIIPKIMLLYYGSEINGMITSITQFINYFNLVEAGLSSAAVYALYKPLAKSDHKQISAVVTATQKFYIKSGYIFLVLVGILACIYPLNIKLDGLSYWQVLFLVLILGFAGVLEFFTLGKYRAILTADQKLYIISISSTLYVILNTALLVFMAVLRVDIVVAKAVCLTAILLRCMILYKYTRRNYPYINYEEQPNNQVLNKRWDALYLQILGVLQTGAPVIIVTIFMDLKAVSVYSIYNMVIGGISGVLGIFINGLSSSFGDIIARNKIQILQRAYQEFEFAYYSLITVAYSVTFIMIMPFIQLYTSGITDAEYNQPVLGLLFVLNALLYDLKTPQGMLVMSAGHYKETRVQVTIQGLIIIVAGIVLTPKLGLTGILFSSIFSNLYRDVDLIFYIPKNVTKLPVYKTLRNIVCLVIEITLINIPFWYFKIVCRNYFEWFRSGVLVTMYAVVVTLSIGWLCNRKEVNGIYDRVREIRRKRNEAL